ncbi:MAG: MoaD/ThiS family protein [Thermoprotei archaeon]
MITVVILPDRIKRIINKPQATIREILETVIGDTNPDSYAITVNDKLVDSEDYVVKSGDKVIVIRQATGG